MVVTPGRVPSWPAGPTLADAKSPSANAVANRSERVDQRISSTVKIGGPGIASRSPAATTTRSNGARHHQRRCLARLRLAPLAHRPTVVQHSGGGLGVGCHTAVPNVTGVSLFDDPSVGTIPEPTYSVTELSDAIGNALRATFRDEVWVRGEIRDLSRASSGHVYFTLTDPDGGRVHRRDAVGRARRAR